MKSFILGSFLVVSVVAAAQSPMVLEIPLGLDAYMPAPEDNPLTSAKIALGRRLFSDPLLSRDGTLACATCHDPQRAFTDGRPVAVGIRGQIGARSAPTLVNRAYGRSQFWDGRARSLEEQVLEPIVNPKELDLTINEAVERLASAAEYRDQFELAFGRSVNREDLARALASYVRTIVSGDSPLDRYMDGERDALPAQARDGLSIFRGKGNCTACHVGPLLTDEQFHNTGVAWRGGVWRDLGRFGVTGNDADRGAFKTPTLREIARTAPYMHDGSFATLSEVIEFYDRGGNANAFRDRELRPLDLTDGEKQALLSFLRSLTRDVYEGPDALVEVK